MKLKYEFELMDIGDEVVAVPAGDSKGKYHGMLRMNQDAAEMLKLVQTHSRPEDVLDELCRQYPDMDRNDLGQELCNYLNRLVAEGILEP